MDALLTTVVGSYPQPDWLIDRERLGDRLPPRVRARELWRVREPLLEEAQDDATRLAVAGHGARRRRRHHRRRDAAGELLQPLRDRARRRRPRPARASRSTAPATRTPSRGSSARSGARGRSRCATSSSCASLTDRRIKITVPGPFTMTQQAQNDHYGDERSLALAYAEAVNEELRDLKAAGADVVQIDEPYLQARPEPAREYARRGDRPRARRNRGRHGAPHVLRLRGHRPRPADRLPVPARARRLRGDRRSRSRRRSRTSTPRCCASSPTRRSCSASSTSARPRRRRPRSSPSASAARSRWSPPERLVVAPDCGMKYLPRDLAFAKLEAMVAGAALVREDLGL